MINKERIKNEIDRLEEYINNSFKDESVKFNYKKVLIDYYENVVFQKSNSSDASYCLISAYIVAFNLRKMRLANFNWNTLCKLYNCNFYKILSMFDTLEITNHQRVALKIIKESIEGRKSVVGLHDYRELLLNFYNHLSMEVKFYNYKNIKEIEEYKKLLIPDRMCSFLDINYNLSLSNYYKEVFTNFPIKSDFRNIVSIGYAYGKSNLKVITNYNLGYVESTIKKLLTEFIYKLYEKNYKQYTRPCRLFCSKFSDSLDGYSISKITDFSYETLKAQYKFYLNLYNQNKRIILGENWLCLLLISFYRFLIEKYRKEERKSLFSDLIGKAIQERAIHRIIAEDYRPVFYNIYEKCPIDNKFCIIQNEYSMSNAAQANYILFVDFTDLEKEQQEDLKNFVWNAPYQIRKKVNYVKYIIEFIRCKENNDKFRKLKKDKFYILDCAFMAIFRDYIDNQYTNYSMRKYALNIIRAYIKFTEKYVIENSTLEFLSVKGLNNFSGGSVITENDMRTLYTEFRNLEKDDVENRIYTIIFEIFTQSNMRIGEILSLERDCLAYSKDSIRLLRKMSKLEYIYIPITSEIKELIKEAVNLTEFSCDGTYMDKFIFINTKSTYFSRQSKIISFYLYFKKVIKKCEHKLEIKSYYPYNLRHTYIDFAYREGLKNNLSINEIATICGNSYDAAVKYYRNMDEIGDYVEALSKTTFSEVTLNGEILKEDNVSIKNNVRNNLGKCRKSACTFELLECLQCNSFITFLSRRNIFEERIHMINMCLEKTNDELEIEKFNIEKKLLAKYYYEMCKMIQGEKSNETRK